MEKYTSAEAAKLLRKLNDDYYALIKAENDRCVFTVATTENVEDVRPIYDYSASRDQLAEITTKIRKIKHAINIFNTTHIVPGFDMTVDEMLVYIPQLTQTKSILASMKDRMPRTRRPVTNGVIEYNYTNYDPQTASDDYTAISNTLSKAQLALDLLNSTETMEIDI